MPNKNTDKNKRELLFIALADSVLETPDDEIIAETKEQGNDPQEIANKIDSIFQLAILAHKKKRLVVAKEKYEAKTATNQSTQGWLRRSIEENLATVKKWIESKTAAGMGDAVLQFRDYESMSAEDLDSAIQQLIQLGEIDPKDL